MCASFFFLNEFLEYSLGFSSSILFKSSYFVLYSDIVEFPILQKRIHPRGNSLIASSAVHEYHLFILSLKNFQTHSGYQHTFKKIKDYLMMKSCFQNRFNSMPYVFKNSIIKRKRLIYFTTPWLLLQVDVILLKRNKVCLYPMATFLDTKIPNEWT